VKIIVQGYVAEKAYETAWPAITFTMLKLQIIIYAAVANR
jgi:hypothetical protein